MRTAKRCAFKVLGQAMRSCALLPLQRAGSKPLPPVGSRAVHRRLLQLQQRLLWQLVGSCLEDEARGAALNSNFSYSLASSVLAAVASPSPSRPMAALRPLVLKHLAVSR